MSPQHRDRSGAGRGDKPARDDARRQACAPAVQAARRSPRATARFVSCSSGSIATAWGGRPPPPTARGEGQKGARRTTTPPLAELQKAASITSFPPTNMPPRVPSRTTSSPYEQTLRQRVAMAAPAHGAMAEERRAKEISPPQPQPSPKQHHADLGHSRRHPEEATASSSGVSLSSGADPATKAKRQKATAAGTSNDDERKMGSSAPREQAAEDGWRRQRVPVFGPLRCRIRRLREGEKRRRSKRERH